MSPNRGLPRSNLLGKVGLSLHKGLSILCFLQYEAPFQVSQPPRCFVPPRQSFSAEGWLHCALFSRVSTFSLFSLKCVSRAAVTFMGYCISLSSSETEVMRTKSWSIAGSCLPARRLQTQVISCPKHCHQHDSHVKEESWQISIGLSQMLVGTCPDLIKISSGFLGMSMQAPGCVPFLACPSMHAIAIGTRPGH